jgi:hypothetical protein
MSTVDTMIMIAMNTKLGQSEQKMKKASPQGDYYNTSGYRPQYRRPCQDHAMHTKFIYPNNTEKIIALLNKLRLYLLDSI